MTTSLRSDGVKRTAASSPTTQTSLTALHVIRESITAFTTTSSQWTARAPGLSTGPALRLDSPETLRPEQIEEAAAASAIHVAALPPIFGPAWEEHQANSLRLLEAVPGVKTLKTNVASEVAWLEKNKLAHGDDDESTPSSSNGPFLATQWQEVLWSAMCQGPVTDVNVYFAVSEAARALPSGRVPNGRSLEGAAKVDVVACGGARWVRVLPTRASSLLSEFREQESYLDSDDEETINRAVSNNIIDGEPDDVLRNCSIVKVASELVKAAEVHSRHATGTSATPHIEIVLTRLGPDESSADPSGPQVPTSDPGERARFLHRLRCITVLIERMGATVHLGPRLRAPLGSCLPSQLATQGSAVATLPCVVPALPSPPPLRRLQAGPSINLDLSALVALVSDISHCEFPHIADRQTAGHQSRSTPPELSALFVRAHGPAEDTPHPIGPHGRALASQLHREMRGEEFMVALASRGRTADRTRLAQEMPTSPPTTLCATQDAYEKFMEIVKTVPGEQERQRALAVFETDEQKASDMFWSHSRWRGTDEIATLLRSAIRLPIKLLPAESYDAVGHSDLTALYPDVATRQFAQRLCMVARASLELLQSADGHLHATSSVVTSQSTEEDASTAVKSTIVGASVKMTAHTLHSVLAGAALGMSTYTTNSASIRWLIKQMGSVDALPEAVEAPSSASASSVPYANALFFVAHPRSLAERMRISAGDNHAIVNKTVSADGARSTDRSAHAFSMAHPSGSADLPSASMHNGSVAGHSSASNMVDSTAASSKSPYDTIVEKAAPLGVVVPVLRAAAGSSISDSNHPRSAMRRSDDGSDAIHGRRRKYGSAFLRFIDGPHPRKRLVIRHYRWWPFRGVEEAWLRLTAAVAWKPPYSLALPRDDAEDHQESYDMESPPTTPRTAHNRRRRASDIEWFSAISAEVRTNWLHWLLLIVTCLLWAIGFALLAKQNWYSAEVTMADGSTDAPAFYGCTSTYWTINSRCGMDGEQCAPFVSDTPAAFRCPAGCLGTILGGKRAVGPLLPAYIPLVVGGLDQNQTYRSDSFICAAAVHAGVLSDSRGGCSSMTLTGSFSNYIGGNRNGVDAQDFNSTFPSSFRFDEGVTSTRCADHRERLYALDVVLSAFVGFVLRPKRIVWFWILACAGFWHINFVSEPRDFPPPIGDEFGDFLPFLFGAFVIWRLAFRFIWPAFERLPIEREIWTLGFWWIGVLLNVVFAKVPINRLVASDIANQPGSLTALLIIIVVVIIIAINQLRVMRSVGALPKFVTLTLVGGVIIGLLAAVPTTGLRLHHYIIALILVCFCSFPTRLSLIYAALLLGMYTNGVARWGFDGIVQDEAVIIGDGITDSSLPVFLSGANYSASQNVVSWQPVPSDLSSDWDSFQLLIDDVLRYTGSDTSLNISQTLLDDYASSTTANNTYYPDGPGAVNATLAVQPHYLRIAYANAKTGDLGDFTRAATAYFNGTWIDAPEGAT